MADEKRLIAYDPITFEAFTRHATKHYDPYYDPYGEGFTDAVDNIEGWLNNNTVDTVEVVHGRWEDVSLRFTQVKEKCSVCGGIVYAHGFNYCPNCGAKMDGEEKDSNLLFADLEEIIDA